jgi:hypothetical protein
LLFALKKQITRESVNGCHRAAKLRIGL